MAALPPPPDTNAWEEAITSAVEGLLTQVQELQRKMDILIEQARLRLVINTSEDAILVLDEAMQVSPLKGRKRARTDKEPSVESDEGIEADVCTNECSEAQ